MKRTSIIAAALGLATALPAVAQPGWTGTYTYEEPLGRDAVGTGLTISVTHKLTLSPSGCRLTANGYQTNTQIRCAAAAKGDQVVVSFVSFGDGKLTNQYGVKLYDAGKPLLTLSRQGGRLITTWQAYEPQLDTHKPAGAYFKKTG